MNNLLILQSLQRYLAVTQGTFLTPERAVPSITETALDILVMQVTATRPETW